MHWKLSFSNDDLLRWKERFSLRYVPENIHYQVFWILTCVFLINQNKFQDILQPRLPKQWYNKSSQSTIFRKIASLDIWPLDYFYSQQCYALVSTKSNIWRDQNFTMLSGLGLADVGAMNLRWNPRRYKPSVSSAYLQWKASVTY